ncbi:enoyl-CoA hydratase/isomerase family protein [Enhygromyxa salina]|uniref:2,3-dehydroadipyl-CoA hydratase n=1 Tax=Enhygromyxa salina TaxID=215803 RepID=A0A2S9YXH1_9BACT|nr:enoyl-CoA hydratase/isomerase family protein [Enhygromyxa salina]PRQ09788.1 2,3-dehydroadipyl-CoA hydratase [Enhygromyxa salina]
MLDFELPETPNLALRHEGSVLHVTFNRPAVRNAMSFAMVEEIIAVFDAIADSKTLRVVVLRGAGGHFCAGGDIRDMAAARMAAAPDVPGSPDDPMVIGNRKFGTMLSVIETAPQAVIAVLEGAVMGGGFGLACVADVSLAHADAKFRLPETSLGIPPAQIAAFIVRRVGLTQARRFAVTGGRLDGREAMRVGIAHEVYDDDEALEVGLAQTLAQIRRCAPGAVAVTKDLVISSLSENLEVLLDRAAREFALAIRGPEGQEGTRAFIEKRDPSWARDDA